MMPFVCYGEIDNTNERKIGRRKKKYARESVTLTSKAK